MFVKKSWNTKEKNPRIKYNIVRSYREKGTGKTKHEYLMNISFLPQHVIDAIDRTLKNGPDCADINAEVKTGDALRGAGLLAIHRMWKKAKIDGALKGLSEAQKKSVELMVIQRILEPGSKLSIKKGMRNTILKKIWSKNRFDEDELYLTMDALNEKFYEIQKALRRQNTQEEPVMLLYDITSTYFEGTKAEGAEYGYSRDKRWDRHQIVIGLVCTGDGLPLALEVWDGSTTDKTTVANRIRVLKKQFKITKGIFVGDAGMYTEANINEIINSGFDYIIKPEWHIQKEQLAKQKSYQRELIDRGVVEWTDNDIRYIGYFSEARQYRSKTQRENGLDKAEDILKQLSVTAAKGKYYSWTRLKEKANDILEHCKVKNLINIDIEPVIKVENPEEKALFSLKYEFDAAEIEFQKSIDGMYIIETSLSSDNYAPEKIERTYKSLQLVERAFRNIKTFLCIRPIYHYRRRRIRAHVLICFLAYYIVKKLEIELRANEINQEVVPLIRDWDNLKLVEVTLTAGELVKKEFQWSLGEIGEEIKMELEKINWWKSMDSYLRSLTKK